MAPYDTYLEMKALVEKHRPDLLPSFPPATAGFHHMAEFLTEHFPRDGGWWTRYVENGPADLREMLQGEVTT